MTDWLRNAGDFWAVGFEAWREPIEVRPVDDAVLGAAMRPRCLVPTKGISRASIILFGVCYTYSNLRNSMESEETQDFVRRPWAGWARVDIKRVAVQQLQKIRIKGEGKVGNVAFNPHSRPYPRPATYTSGACSS